MNSTDLQHARKVAIDAADAAQKVIRSYLSSGDWSVSYKQDDSPVTKVDIATEHAIKSVLTAHTPKAAFYGEETGRSPAQSNNAGSRNADDSVNRQLWLVDPIDGTKSFIRNMPFYSTQIALQVGNDLCVGVSNAPAFGERIIASVGGGAWLNENRVECRNTTSLSDVFLSTGNLNRMAKSPACWEVLGQIMTQVRRVRGYGDFCHYHQLCCGQTDLIIESDVNILDIAALTVAVREAGGVITDLAGREIGLDTTSVLAAGTNQLHADVLAMIQPVFKD